MVNSGANVALIQSALNHKDLRTTFKVYAKVAKRAELEARAKAHELMLGGNLYEKSTNIKTAATTC